MAAVTRTCVFVNSVKLARLALVPCREKATVASVGTEHSTEPRPFSEIPEPPKGLPIIGTWLEALEAARATHLWTLKRHQELGPIFKFKALKLDMVLISDADAVEQLLRQDGKYPGRMPIDMWIDYRKRHNIPMGLFMAEGSQWQRLRRVVDKPMLKIKTVNSYAGDLNEVTTDFIDRLTRVRSSDNSIPQLDEELFRWSMESIGKVLYETRLGCLSDNRDPDTQAFIDSAHAMVETTRELFLLPVWAARLFWRKSWKRHEEAWNTSFRIAYKTIDAKIKDIEAKADDGGEVGFLASFLQEKSLPIENIYSNISELMGAAIDTTSNTTQMLIYELSRNPDVQKTLLDEVNRVVPLGQPTSPDHLKDMHYLKAVIKETLRMYPIGSAVIRILRQDAVVLNYKLPEGTTIGVFLYGLGRDPKYYDDPESFRPERWLRVDGKSKIHPFAWLPFGFGPRMCVGRRVAELEIQLLVSQLIRKFGIEPVSNKPVEMKTELLLLPKSPVQVRLVDRN